MSEMNRMNRNLRALVEGKDGFPKYKVPKDRDAMEADLRSALADIGRFAASAAGRAKSVESFEASMGEDRDQTEHILGDVQIILRQAENANAILASIRKNWR